MKKRYLLSPGPVEVPAEVLLEMAKPLIHHRTEEYQAIFKEVQEGLKYLFQASRLVYILTSSGTGAMECAVSNFHSAGDKVLVIRGGKFGERWGEISKAYNLNVIPIDIEWGTDIDIEVIKRYLDREKDIKSILMQYCETSTATKYNIKEVAKLTREREDTLIIVDAISAIGAMECPVEEWELDVVVGGSQKSFMLPPGLSFIYFSEKAEKRLKMSNLPKYYFDLQKEMKMQAKSDTAYTSAISLIIGLNKALKMIRDFGLENLINRYKKMAEASRKGLKALGFEIFSKSPSDSVTAGIIPKGIDGKELVSILRERYGVTVAGGQGKLKGKIIRIGHLGYTDYSDLYVVFGSLEKALYRLGYKFEIGSSLKAIQETLIGE